MKESRGLGRSRPRRAIGIAAIAIALVAPAAAAGQRPNLVFVLTDDQRPETIAMMPQTRAAFGVTFRRFFVTTPTCCPSRASFLTGRWMHSTGVRTTSRAGYEAFQRIEPGTLAPWLQEQGYLTGFMGKYFNTFDRSDPVPPGWNEFNGRLYGADAGNGATTFGLREFRTEGGVVVQNDVVAYPNDDDPEPYATRVFGAKAEAFVRRATNPVLNPEGQPFALFLWTSGVNTLLPEPVYADAPLPAWAKPPSFLEADVRDKPRAVRAAGNPDPARHEAVRATQLRQSITIDDVVGDLVGLLDELGLRESTWGFFGSDNGHLWGEHRLTGKWYAYEESVRVPFRMMLPGGERFGIRALTANVDLAPTVMALAGEEEKRGFEGRSLLPLLSNPEAPWRKQVLIELYNNGYCAVRRERWKYIQYATGEEELYDLERDRYELESLHRERPAVVIHFRGIVRRSACDPPGFRPLRDCTRKGTRRADRLRGTDLRDWICAGDGRDTVLVRGGGRDVVRCGPGRDVAFADPADELRGCEDARVKRA